MRILDLTAVVLGPLATQILADYGADVIKIEGPEGDLMRANGISLHQGMSSIFLTINRNKRSVCLDLKSAEGVQALRTLIPTADVLVHNMRCRRSNDWASAMRRFGSSSQTLSIAWQPDSAAMDRAAIALLSTTSSSLPVAWSTSARGVAMYRTMYRA